MQIDKRNKENFKTKVALLLMNITNEPLVACYTLLPFILRKELHINAFQLSLFVMLKPVLLSLSFFWGVSVKYKQNPNLLRNSLIACILARIPFLFFPFINNFYYIFLASSIYLLFHRAGLPALTEIIKRNVTHKKERFDLFSKFAVYIFIESAFLGLFIGRFLSKSTYNWKILFFLAAFFSLIGLALKMKIKVPLIESQSNSYKQNIFSPIKDVFSLLKRRKDFARFQLGFIIGGGALMFISPALYIFCSDTLKLTHMDMTNARLVLMGLGFVISSHFWKKFLLKTYMNNVMTWVITGFCIYIFLLLLSQYSLVFFYLAFFFYGISQAGSTLLWNLSGMIFAKDENSIIFTSTNILFLGMRGLVAPLLGSFFCHLLGSSWALFIGLLLLIYGAYYMYRLNIKAYYAGYIRT